MDNRLALMCGIDLPIPECQLIIHQPTLKEIAYVGETDFLAGVQTLCISKNIFSEKDKALLGDTNNFQIFMTIMSDKQTVEKKHIVQQVLTLFLLNYKIIFTPRGVVFINEEQNSITIDEVNFESLQNMISTVCCLNNSLGGEQSYNPAEGKAKEIAEKLMRGRQRAAAQKGDSVSSIYVQYISVLTVGIHSMTLNDIMNLTIYQLYDLIERYTLYTNWDIDIRARLAGATPEGKPDNWMKNIH